MHPSQRTCQLRAPTRTIYIHYFMVLLRTAGAAGLLGILYTTIRSTNPAFLGTLTNNITRSMSTQAGKEGITAWADKDGSFKRQVSSFRDRIEEGGKFAPEKGKLSEVGNGHELMDRTIPPLRLPCLSLGSSSFDHAKLEGARGLHQ
jgi:hypothetical protein